MPNRCSLLQLTLFMSYTGLSVSIAVGPSGLPGAQVQSQGSRMKQILRLLASSGEKSSPEAGLTGLELQPLDALVHTLSLEGAICPGFSQE